jgi:hypothetical protein
MVQSPLVLKRAHASERAEMLRDGRGALVRTIRQFVPGSALAKVCLSQATAPASLPDRGDPAVTFDNLASFDFHCRAINEHVSDQTTALPCAQAASLRVRGV